MKRLAYVAGGGVLVLAGVAAGYLASRPSGTPLAPALEAIAAHARREADFEGAVERGTRDLEERLRAEEAAERR